MKSILLLVIVLVSSCTTNYYNDPTFERVLTDAKAFKADGNMACFFVTKPDNLAGRYCVMYEEGAPSAQAYRTNRI